MKQKTLATALLIRFFFVFLCFSKTLTALASEQNSEQKNPINDLVTLEFLKLLGYENILTTGWMIDQNSELQKNRLIELAQEQLASYLKDNSMDLNELADYQFEVESSSVCRKWIEKESKELIKINYFEEEKSYEKSYSSDHSIFKFEDKIIDKGGKEVGSVEGISSSSEERKEENQSYLLNTHDITELYIHKSLECEEEERNIRVLVKLTPNLFKQSEKITSILNSALLQKKEDVRREMQNMAKTISSIGFSRRLNSQPINRVQISKSNCLSNKKQKCEEKQFITVVRTFDIDELRTVFGDENGFYSFPQVDQNRVVIGADELKVSINAFSTHLRLKLQELSQEALVYSSIYGPEMRNLFEQTILSQLKQISIKPEVDYTFTEGWFIFVDGQMISLLTAADLNSIIEIYEQRI